MMSSTQLIKWHTALCNTKHGCCDLEKGFSLTKYKWYKFYSNPIHPSIVFKLTRSPVINYTVCHSNKSQWSVQHWYQYDNIMEISFLHHIHHDPIKCNEDNTEQCRSVNLLPNPVQSLGTPHVAKLVCTPHESQLLSEITVSSFNTYTHSILFNRYINSGNTRHSWVTGLAS